MPAPSRKIVSAFRRASRHESACPPRRCREAAV